MSRAGRRARRERLIAAGQWEPYAILAETQREQDDNRTRALIAERDEWIREVGLLGWQREQNRRRAECNARLRNRSQTITRGESNTQAKFSQPNRRGGNQPRQRQTAGLARQSADGQHSHHPGT